MSGEAGIVSIELLLDADAERRIRLEWEALAAAGLSSMAAYTAESNRPHITLLVRREVPAFALDEISPLLPLPLEIGAPVLFGVGERRVLARSVVATEPLLALHRRLHEAVARAAGDVAEGGDAPHTSPGRWTPHVTLARRVQRARLGDALAAVGGSIPARAVGLRRWDSAARTVTPLLSTSEGGLAGPSSE